MLELCLEQCGLLWEHHFCSLRGDITSEQLDWERVKVSPSVQMFLCMVSMKNQLAHLNLFILY